MTIGMMGLGIVSVSKYGGEDGGVQIVTATVGQAKAGI